MPEASNSKTFIGPRILTRRRFLRGLGGGAATLGLGYVQACSWCQPKPTPEERLRRNVGKKGTSYLDRKVKDPRVVDYVAQRAASFGDRCEGGSEIPPLELSLTDEPDIPQLDAGGFATNDLRFWSAVDLEGSPALTEYLSGNVGREVTSENADCLFSTTRFYATATSLANNRILIGITDSVVAFVRDGPLEDEQTTQNAFLIDCAGINQISSRKVGQVPSPPGEKVDQLESIPGRPRLINAYFDHIVGYYDEPGGGTAYFPFDPSEAERFSPQPRSTEYFGTRVVEYLRIPLDLRQHTSKPPPSAPQDPDSRNDVSHDFETAIELGQVQPFIESGLAASGGETIVRCPPSCEPPPSPPGGGNVRFGDPARFSIADFRCTRDSRDECENCCDTAQIGGMALGGSICLSSVFCGPAAPLCAPIACLLGGGLLLTSFVLGRRCADNCRFTFTES